MQGGSLTFAQDEDIAVSSPAAALFYAGEIPAVCSKTLNREKVKSFAPENQNPGIHGNHGSGIFYFLKKRGESHAEGQKYKDRTRK